MKLILIITLIVLGQADQRTTITIENLTVQECVALVQEYTKEPVMVLDGRAKTVWKAHCERDD